MNRIEIIFFFIYCKYYLTITPLPLRLLRIGEIAVPLKYAFMPWSRESEGQVFDSFLCSTWQMPVGLSPIHTSSLMEKSHPTI